MLGQGAAWSSGGEMSLGKVAFHSETAVTL